VRERGEREREKLSCHPTVDHVTKANFVVDIIYILYWIKYWLII